MMMRSLLGLLIAVMLVLSVTAGHADDRHLSLRGSGHLEGLGDAIQDAIDDFLRRARGGVERFATLPSGDDLPRFPEGIAADAEGNIYVATFDTERPNVIYVFNRRGRLVTTTPVEGAPLGLAVGPDEKLYVANFLAGKVQRFLLPLGPTSLPDPAFNVQVCTLVFFVDCGLNAITFDAGGTLYVSDSFGGKIYAITPAGTSSPFFSDEQLKPGAHAFPPFGANGLAFSPDGKFLFIANTGDDRIFKLDKTATPPLTRFSDNVNGPDGILFDGKGRLWVAENQNDRVVALDEDGRIVERRGSFEGVGPDGAPKGLSFPASIVLSKGSIFVTNAALVLIGNGSEPEADVSTYTVSRIRLGHDND